MSSRRYLFHPRLFVCLAAAGIWISTHAATIIWTNTAGGNWSAATNWSPNQIPGAADTALITNSGNYTVTLGANAQISGFVVGATSGKQILTVTSGNTFTATNGIVGTNGIMALTGSTYGGFLTVNGTLDWTNGTIATGGGVTVMNNAAMNIGGGSAAYFLSGLTNGGTVTWSGSGSLNMYDSGANGGVIINQAGAVFNAQSDQSIYTTTGSPYFINAGTFLKSAGVNTTVDVLFTNTGTLNVATGTVTINNGGNNSGIITGAGSVTVPSGTLNMTGAVPTLILDGGTITGTSLSITNLTWSSGTIFGTNVIITLANWTGGTIGAGGLLTVASNAVLNISGGGTEFFSGELANAGTVNWSSSANLQLYYSGGNTGFIYNQAGGLFNVQNDENIYSSAGSPFFINAGTFLKSAGVNTTVNVLFTNTGTLNVATGTVTINNGGSQSGLITGAGSVTVPSGTMNMIGPVPTLILNGGTIYGSNLSLTNLTWSNGTIYGTNTITTLANWTGGTIGSGGLFTVASNAVLNISGGGTEFFSGELANAGTVNWSSTANLQLYYSGANTGFILNQAGGLFNVQNDENIYSSAGSPFFINAGTFQKSAGNNTTVNVNFTNTGAINVTSGTITFNNGGTESGIITGPGSITVPSGTMNMNGGVPNLILNGGTINGTGLSITNLTWSNGTMLGTNMVATLASWTGGTIGAAGLLMVASNAVLNISGNGTEALYGELANAGRVNWSSTANMQLYYFGLNTGFIFNQAGALFNAQNDESILASGGAPFFVNAGTFQKSSGSNTTVGVTFTNSGTINAASGAVVLNNGGADNGTVTGPGSVSVTGGTLYINGAVPNLILAGGIINGGVLTATNFTWSSGTLTGTNIVATQLSWTSGSIGAGGQLTIASNAVLNISGSGNEALSGVLVNFGTVNWGGTGVLQLYFYSANTGCILNQPGAVFNVQNDQYINSGGGGPYFVNAGTFEKTTGSNTTLYVTFTNTGTINLASGTVSISNGGVESGTVTGPGNLNENGGTFTILGAVPNLILAGGVVNGTSLTVTNFTWSSGTLEGTNTIAGLASWASGNLNGSSSLTIASNAVLNISGSAGKGLSGALTNWGTVNWSGTGGINLYYYSANIGCIVNQTGALFNVQNDQTIGSGGGSPFFSNAGTFQKSAGTNTSISTAFNTTGTLNLGISGRTNFTQLNFSGNVGLGGVINIGFSNNYAPAVGDSFPLLTYGPGSESGIFSATNLPNDMPYWESNTITYGATAFTLAIGSLYQLAFTPGPVATNSAGTPFTAVVQVETANGTLVATNAVPVMMALSSGSGTLSGTLVQNTDASGKATFNNLSLSIIGQKILTASSPPWLTPVSSLVLITSGPPAQLRMITSTAGLQKQGYFFAPAPSVLVLDQFGNIVSNTAALITATSTSTGYGSLAGTTGVHANGTNGLATFNSLRYNLANSNQSESITLYFMSPGLVPATNNGLVIVDYLSGFITLTNGNSLVQVDPNSQDGVFSWVVDGSDQMYQHWFWLRQGTGPQVSFDALGTPLGISATSSNAMINYLPQGLNVMLAFALQGGVGGSAASTLTETISIQNTNSSSASLHLYDYMDLDLAGSSAGDSVSFPTTNLVVQTGKGVTATQSVSPAPSYWEGSWYAFAFDTINSTNPAVLSDSIIPNQPGDQTFAYQWDVNLGAGQTLTLTLTNNVQGVPNQAVRLAITKSGANVLLSWPTNGTGSLNLQASSSLTGGGAWTNVMNSYTVVGTNYQVALPPAGAAQFYRIH